MSINPIWCGITLNLVTSLLICANAFLTCKTGGLYRKSAAFMQKRIDMLEQDVIELKLKYGLNELSEEPADHDEEPPTGIA